MGPATGPVSKEGMLVSDSDVNGPERVTILPGLSDSPVLAVRLEFHGEFADLTVPVFFESPATVFKFVVVGAVGMLGKCVFCQ